MTLSAYKIRGEICEKVYDIQADLETLFDWFREYKIESDSKAELEYVRTIFSEASDKIAEVNSDDFRFLDSVKRYEIIGKGSQTSESVKITHSKSGHGESNKLRIDVESEREKLLNVIDGAWTYYSFVIGRIHEITSPSELSTLLYGYCDDESRIEWIIEQYVDLSKMTLTDTEDIPEPATQSQVREPVAKTLAEGDHA